MRVEGFAIPKGRQIQKIELFVGGDRSTAKGKFEKPDTRIKLEAKWEPNVNKIIGFDRRKLPKVRQNTCSEP